jgi:glycosyltransferase involved in cell wall biosynthesis
MKIAVVLTQYKRNNLQAQLHSILHQSIKIDTIVVFQNGSHVDITPIKKAYDFNYVYSDINTKFFGRFSYCFTLDVDIILVLDDDIIPGPKCIENYVNQCMDLNAIIGGNGRIAQINKNSRNLQHPVDVGYRKNSVLVDFVGHIWCFKKKWLHYMFSIPPCTYDTGEDMHLCFSSKVLGDINSYCAKQLNLEEQCDITMNQLAVDKYSSFKTTSSQLRRSIEEYFQTEYNLKFIETNL